ncbi:MAG TPA: NAD(P)-dependent oxidoreductase [Puia sp.]|nr:NAD(P)-dependent oxidoreductase [Puia sp.]
MRILVTGATGFIGRYAIAELLRAGHKVVASSAVPEKAASMTWYNEVDYIPLNLARLDETVDYYQYFGRPDSLLHLAWEGLPNYKEAFHLESNYPRHAVFLDNMLRHGLADLTVSGTCLEYGMQEGALREDLPSMPATPYAMAKDMLRRHLQAQNTIRTFGFRWLRLFYMYGGGQNPKSLFSQLDRALEENAASFNMSGGEQVRDFLPVEKMAEYIARVATRQDITGIINVCSGRPVTVKALVETYLRQKGRSLTLNLGYYPYPEYEPMHFWGDDSKLRSIV